MTTFPAHPSTLRFKKMKIIACAGGDFEIVTEGIVRTIDESEARKLIRFLNYHLELVSNQRERSYARTYTKVSDGD